MAFPGSIYAPPSVYTKTLYENPLSGAIAGVKIPVLIGTGSEILSQNDLELVRGSSSTVDQQVVQEDMAGRIVVSELASGAVTLGDYDGSSSQVQVRNYPIVTGDGSGTTTTKPSDVTVTLNGSPVVVMAIDGAKGLLTLSESPSKGDSLKVTYFFNRTDTLVTDDVSDQVTGEAASLYLAKAGDYSITEDATDSLILTVDGEEIEITLVPTSGALSASDLVTQIKASAGTSSLSAATYTNNEGNTSVYITATNEVVVGAGTANSALGISQGASAGRNKVFYVFNGPIVDGSNGGVTTTDGGDVTVKVDGIQVIPDSVDGATRAVTLALAPAAGSTVTIQYYFNTWQDTFDYLAHTGVTAITYAGLSAGRSDFVQGVDFVLKDDKILWGTAVLVASGEHTTGYEYFTDSQITANLVDNKGYMEPCSAVVDTSVVPALVSTTVFTLPFIPTTGNGRGTPIGSSLFQTVSNGRIDLPTDRPDLVIAYWGYNIQDALDRGAVDVVKVDYSKSQVTLKDAVPAGASVWVTQYYNVIQDTSYNVVVESADVSGVGTYSMTDKNGTAILIPSYVSKSAALATVNIEFPSGSELLSDVRFESPHSITKYTGAIEETVTVTFATKPDTPASFALKSKSPFYFIDSNSDKFEFTAVGATASADTTITLSSTSYQAHILGDVIDYLVSTSSQQNVVTEGSNDSLIYTMDDQVIETTFAPSSTADIATLINKINSDAQAVPVKYTCKSKISSAFNIITGQNDNLTFTVAGGSANSITLAGAVSPGTAYVSASDLVAQINTQINLDPKIRHTGGAASEVAITASVNSQGQIVFSFLRGATNMTSVVISSTDDLGAQLGIDASVLNIGKTGSADYEVARMAMDAVSGTDYFFDRISLRNRIEPKGFIGLAQANLSVNACTAKDIIGISIGDYGSAGKQADTHEATMYGEIGMTANLSTADGWPEVTFYGPKGTTPQNNVFIVSIDGTQKEIKFTDNTGGTIGDGSSANVAISLATHGIVEQINTAFGSTVAYTEGFGIRLLSAKQDSSSSIIIGSGSANSVLGFSNGQSASRTGVTVAEVVSCIHSVASASATNFMAGIIKDDAGDEFIYLQSDGIGSSSSVLIKNDAANNTALRKGTGVIDELGDGAVGEAGKSGYYVVSDMSDGSGSANDSVLNAGAGQDGVVGQTYRDLVTGLTFTILPRATGVVYPPTGSLTFSVSATATTDANIPISAVKGVDLIVANTEDIAEGDTAVVTTYRRSGEQPAVGDTYYATYSYSKQDFVPRLFSKFSTVEAAFGSLSSENPLSLGCYLAMTNGAILVGLKQVIKDSTPVAGVFTQASITAYRDAVDDMGGTFAGGTNPDILVPLRGDDLELYRYMARHANIQSSIRYKSERTIIAGCAAGTKRDTAKTWAKAIKETRFRLLYPDMFYMTITDAFGNDSRNLLDGTYLACALAGAIVAPSKDVATPWTRTRLFGMDSLARENDAVQKNQIAAAGITVLEDTPAAIQVRHGLTTDLDNILTKTPTVIQIADEVQQLARQALDKFVGTKFLPSVTAQIEGVLSMTLKELVRQEIIAGYTGVSAAVDADDPTVANIEAYYQPVFPLLYLVVTFNMRSSL